jgi:hypothetical protein
MITLKTTSEEISAWLRNRAWVPEWSQFSDHELCHIRVRRSVVESAFGAKSGAERTTKRDPRPSAGNTPPISTDGRRRPWSFAKIGHGIVSFAVDFRYSFWVQEKKAP